MQLVVAYSLKAKTVQSQQSAVSRQRPVNSNKEMVISARCVSMAAFTTMEYMPPLSNNRTATEERCFLCGPCRNTIRRIISQKSVSQSVEWIRLVTESINQRGWLDGE
jgi:hypothetical protein